MQHAGVFEAVERVGAEVPTPQQVEAALHELSETHTKMAVVGTIVDAWINANSVTVIAFTIKPELTGVTFMVENGFARGLSLTHAESKQPLHQSKLVPYEVTLCSEPARPGAWVFYKTASLISLAKYKRDDLLRGSEYTRNMPAEVMDVTEPSSSTTVVAASAEKTMTPLEAALAGVTNEEHRKLLAERFTAMVAATDAEKTRAADAELKRQELEKKLNEQQVTSRINQEMLQNQLQMLQANVGTELSSTFHLDPQATKCALESGDANVVRDTFERAIMAANRRMMQLAADQSLVDTRKRSRESEPVVLAPEVVAASEAAAAAVPKPAAAAPAVVAASAPAAMDTAGDATGQNLLMRAMAATFQY